jgi:hypothetical protein
MIYRTSQTPRMNQLQKRRKKEVKYRKRMKMNEEPSLTDSNKFGCGRSLMVSSSY